MTKFLLAFALAIAVLGGAIAISAISRTHRSPSHWRSLSSSVVRSLLPAFPAHRRSQAAMATTANWVLHCRGRG